MLFDPRGFPDAADEWESMLPEVGDTFLRKRMHPVPATVDPAFDIKYNEAKHGKILSENLDLTHLPQPIQLKVLSLIKKYWGVFDPRGLLLPVKDYECEIDTGNHPPVRCKNVTYGPLETPLIKKAI